jgi:hypothetical protein
MIIKEIFQFFKVQIFSIKFVMNIFFRIFVLFGVLSGTRIITSPNKKHKVGLEMVKSDVSLANFYCWGMGGIGLVVSWRKSFFYKP